MPTKICKPLVIPFHVKSGRHVHGREVCHEIVNINERVAARVNLVENSLPLLHFNFFSIKAFDEARIILKEKV